MKVEKMATVDGSMSYIVSSNAEDVALMGRAIVELAIEKAAERMAVDIIVSKGDDMLAQVHPKTILNLAVARVVNRLGEEMSRGHRDVGGH